MQSRFGQQALVTGATLPTKNLLADSCLGCEELLENLGDYVVVDGHPVCLDCFEGLNLDEPDDDHDYGLEPPDHAYDNADFYGGAEPFNPIDQGYLDDDPNPYAGTYSEE